MPKESTTPDLEEFARRGIEAANRRDFDGYVSFFAPHAVWDGWRGGVRLDGPEAIRGFREEWFGVYEEWKIELEDWRDLGNGVTFSVISQRGRLTGTTAWVQEAFPLVSIWADGLVQHTASYTDIDEASAAAERLAEERG